MHGGRETEIQEKCSPLFQSYLPIAQFIFSWNYLVNIYLFIYFHVLNYDYIITIASTKTAYLGFGLSTGNEFHELTMHFKGTFLFGYI